MSLEEYFWEGPKIRVPPCSFPPFAGAHVGRAAVVMSSYYLQIGNRGWSGALYSEMDQNVAFEEEMFECFCVNKSGLLGLQAKLKAGYNVSLASFG